MDVDRCKDKNKPLKNKIFYLDLKSSKKPEVASLVKDLKSFGGVIEEFLCKDISFVITDRPDWKPVCKSNDPWAPDTPNSAPSPHTLLKCEFADINSPCNEADLKRTQHQMSRGQKLLEHVAKHHKRRGSADVLEISRQWGICILSVLNVLKWLEKTKKNLTKVAEKKVHSKSLSLTIPVVGIKTLTKPFIKVEDKKRVYRTFYKEFTLWPDIAYKGRSKITSQQQENIPRNDAKENKNAATAEGFAAKTRDVCKKQSVKESEEPKVKAYCEICSTSYTNLKQHLKTTYHRNFLSDKTNFMKLKEVISKLSSVDQFAMRSENLQIQKLTRMSKMERTKSSEQKSQKRVATNLTRRFDLCSRDLSDQENANEAKTELTLNGQLENQLDEERIEGSCNSPPYCGFPFLEGNILSSEHSDVIDTHINVGQICDAAQSLFIPVSAAEEYCGNGTSIKDKNMCPLNVHAIELSVLSPPDSVLCNSEDVPTASVYGGCETVVADGTTICIPAGEYVMESGKDTSMVIDLVPMNCNTFDLSNPASVSNGPMNFSHISEKSLKDEESKTVIINLESTNQIDNAGVTADDEVQYSRCIDGRIHQLLSSSEINKNTTVENTVDPPIDNADVTADDEVQYSRCIDGRIDQLLSSSEISKNTTVENTVDPQKSLCLSNRVNCNENQKETDDSVKFESGTLPNNKSAKEDVSLTKIIAVSEMNSVQKQDVHVLDCESKQTSNQTGTVSLKDKKEFNQLEALEHVSNPGIAAFCLPEKNLNCNSNVVEDMDCDQEEWCADCCPKCNNSATLEDNEEFQPLNLCTADSVPDSVNSELRMSESFDKSKVEKRYIESSTSSRKVRVLSDRSVQMLFNSDNDYQDFSGFEPNDKNDISDLSYIEVSCPSEILSSSDCVKYSKNASSELDDKWDGFMVDFIDRQVTDKHQGSFIDGKEKNVDTL